MLPQSGMLWRVGKYGVGNVLEGVVRNVSGSHSKRQKIVQDGDCYDQAGKGNPRLRRSCSAEKGDILCTGCARHETIQATQRMNSFIYKAFTPPRRGSGGMWGDVGRTLASEVLLEISGAAFAL